MANPTKEAFLAELRQRFGEFSTLAGSRSLLEIGETGIRVYVRFSKVHTRSQTFYGLRDEDTRKLEGHPSFLCFLWPSQPEPWIVPFADFEDVFRETTAASDGQYKVQVHLLQEGMQIYITHAGRFSAEGYGGWDALESAVGTSRSATIPDLTHAQVQTMIGHIGASKGLHVWIPANDRRKLDWSVARRFECCDRLPELDGATARIARQIDVIWLAPGSEQLRSLFEVEHTTSVYPALLRFNDLLLSQLRATPGFNIVARCSRRSLFASQVNRPTFRASGLDKLCSFFEYSNVCRLGSTTR